MGIGEGIMEAMKTTVLLNERVASLTEKVSRIDQDQRNMNDRLVRLEARLNTIMDIAEMNNSRQKHLKE